MLIIKNVFQILGMCCLIFFVAPKPADAISLTNISDTTSRLKAQALADHTIQFTTPSGMNGGTMIISLGSTISDMNGIDYSDIDLLYGPIGNEIQRALYFQPGTNTWGVSIDLAAKTITLTYPNTNGLPILSNNRVIIKIGTHATYDTPPTKTTFKQLKNGDPALGGHIIRIQTPYGNGSLAIPIVSEDTIGVRCQSTLSAPTELKAENSAGLVKLAWVDMADNENGFYVERSQEIVESVGDMLTTRYTSFNQILDVRGVNSTFSADDNIDADKTYQYRVRAYNTCGLSGYSNSATVKTPPGTVMLLAPAVAPLEPTATVKPVAPAPVEASKETPREVSKETPKEIITKPASEQKQPSLAEIPKHAMPVPNVSGIRSSSTVNSITLQWQNPSIEDFASVQLQRSTASFPQSVSDGQTVFSGGAQLFIDINLSAGQVYYYTFFVRSKSGATSTGSFLAVTVKELPKIPSPPVLVPSVPASPTTETPSIPLVIPPVPPPPPAAPSGILPAAPAPYESYSVSFITSGVPVAPAVVVILPTEESKVSIKEDEQQRTSVVMQDSSGGTSAFTVDIPANTFAEDTEVAVTSMTTAQTTIIDEDARTPVGFESVGNVVYKIHVKNSKGERVKKFEMQLKLTFRYNDSLIQTINEDSLKVYYWESSLKSWIPLKSSIDTTSNVIIAQVPHATLFSIFGAQRKDISPEKRKKLIVTSKSSTVYKRPESYLFRTEDLHLTSIDQLRGIWSALAAVGQTFYITTSSVVDVCIPAGFFDKETDSVTLSLSDALHTDQYFLTKDSSRQCYATSFVAPKDHGLFRLAIKSKNTDDSVRTNTFSMMTGPWHEIMIVPPILQLGEYVGSPRIAGLIALLIVVIGLFVLLDVYQKVLRRKKKKQ